MKKKLPLTNLENIVTAIAYAVEARDEEYLDLIADHPALNYKLAHLSQVDIILRRLSEEGSGTGVLQSMPLTSAHRDAANALILSAYGAIQAMPASELYAGEKRTSEIERCINPKEKRLERI